jgi:epsilon-lactone hydrolase
MPSKESGALFAFFSDLAARVAANPGMAPADLRTTFEELHSTASEPTDVSYDEVQCPGTVRPAIWCKPLSVTAQPPPVILYFHGGGFVTGSPSSHRKLVAHLAKASGCHALVLDYRLAPEHGFPSAVEDAVAAYKYLLHDLKIPASRIATAGDSAGGNLAVSSVLKMRDLGLELPAAIVGFSPWVDMEVKGKTLTTNAKTDALVSLAGMQMMAMGYLQGFSVQDPIANPLYADFKGMPPMYLTAGTHETLQDNAEMLAERAKGAGVKVELELSEGMQHVYQFMAGRAPEAVKTISEVGAWLSGLVGTGKGKL